MAIPKNFPFHFPWKKQDSEKGPGKKDVLLCPKCGAVYWNKSWHNDFHKYKDKSDFNIKEEVCPACQMIQENRFEGEIRISDIPDQYKEDLKNMVDNMDQTAQEKDPLDRVIDIEDQSSQMRITTTENQLAVQIAKKINKAFPVADLDINYSDSRSKLARVKVVFKK